MDILKEATKINDELHIDLWYPDVEDAEIKKIVVGLMDVRATDDIRISYDKKRDGWKIEQASTFKWDGGDEICDPDWQEVAFVKHGEGRKNYNVEITCYGHQALWR